MDLVLKVSGWKDGGEEGRHKCPFLGQVLKVGDGCECKGHNRRLNLHVHVDNLFSFEHGVYTYVYIHLYMYLYICICMLSGSAGKYHYPPFISKIKTFKLA